MDRAESVKGTYNAGMSEAASEATALSDAQKKAGREEGERIMGEARSSSADYLDNARQELRAGLEQVRKQLAGQSAELAGEIAKKILGGKR
jgi:F0F1-type ATP synthase membrane subunit b/b'